MVKNNLIKSMGLVVLLLIAGATTSLTFAQSSEDVELVVTGDGPTKEKATLSALRSALEQVYGTMVSSNTKILNDKLVKDEIVSISTGIVKKYTYLSEKEVNGKNYVVVKATVSPQKLITYAKSKGASTELAGATFAANVRLQKLNEQNARIACRNISEMQEQIFPQCLDFTIKKISEPHKPTGYGMEDFYGRGRFIVEFTIEIRLNSNAIIIQELESQKPQTTRVIRQPADGLYKTIFDKFKIVDDINDYFFDFFIDYSQNEENYKQRIRVGKGLRNSNNDIRLYLNYSRNGRDSYVSYYLCNSKGRCNDEENIVMGGDIMWKYIIPNRPIIELPLTIAYSLEDLDKITGIHVVLR